MASATDAVGTCTDVAPDTMYTCAQQVDWGKCDEPWMAGKCDLSCGRCGGGSKDAATEVAYPDVGSSTCRPTFAAGVNVAWATFAGDIPNPRIAKFTELFQNVQAAGGHTVRWWFHTNGTVTPGYDAMGLAKPIASSQIDDLKKILDEAHRWGIGLIISLWSFDMLQGTNENIPEAVANANRDLLTVDANRKAYVDNVLTPMVTALAGYPGLYAWEAFNEPEGMMSDPNPGWAQNRVPSAAVQKTINWFADAIHAADSKALVTNGANNFATCSGAAGQTNLYTDAALIAAGGKAKGTLDFYEAHYYDNWGTDNTVVNPFKNQASHFMLDKHVVIGEFWAINTTGIAAGDLFTTLYTNGYNGAWAWQYFSVDNPGPDAATIWPAMQVPIMNLYKAHPADLDCH